jgi:hypothetical protein
MNTIVEGFNLVFGNSLSFTSWVGILLYWTPLSLCVVGYTWRTIVNINRDIKERNTTALAVKENLAIRAGSLKAPLKSELYFPTDTLGDLIGRALVTVIPVANLWAAIFDVAPKMFGKVFHWIGEVFDQPLVPRK